ncbi:hypothetical protein ACFQHV_00360 [Promicromonospora thailandica]|uniref:Uncharacterized protein n=1 Tax=Promicromonospora thailandica TaxID=765201 RepID=A0A9X2FZB0_9MICO|nr:hypothetical protein [Promicromonospora thailandica]MCP2262808.1 hypothetical protein [Promicromonospora thailandica]BFF18141.1 hypothetical protein GCM10025730_16620 [Promicromonospora thailandica]
MLSESPALTGVLALALVSAAAVHLVMVVGYWRGDPRTVERMTTAMSVFSADADKVRGHLRGPLATNISAWGMAVAAVAVFVSDAFDPPGPFEWFVALGGMLLLLLGVAADFTIIYLNWPKILVPRRLRWEPGFVRVTEARRSVQSTSKKKAVLALYDAYKSSS